MSQPASSEALYAEVVGRVHTNEMIPVDVTDSPLDQECGVDHYNLGSTEFLRPADFAIEFADECRMDDSIQSPYTCTAGECSVGEEGADNRTRLDDVLAKLPG